MQILLTLIFTTYTFAFPVRVLQVQGQSAFNEILLKEAIVFTRGGTVKTGSKAKVKLFIEKWNVELIIASNTQVKFDQDTEFTIELIDGSINWKSKKRTSRGKLITKQLLVLPNTNNFMAIHDMKLGESQVMSTYGGVKVSSQNALDKGQILLANQWAGAGLRFGDTVNKPIVIPELLLKRTRDEFVFNKSE